MTGQIAMLPSAASNSVAATEQPLMNAMNKSDTGQAALGGAGGGGGGAFQSKFGEQNAAGQTPAGSMYLLCSTDDPSTASEQVKNYLTDNGIAWEQSVAPLQLRQGDYVAMNRFRSQQVQVTQQDQFAKVPDDERYRYARKDVASERPAEAEAIAEKAGRRAVDGSKGERSRHDGRRPDDRANRPSGRVRREHFAGPRRGECCSIDDAGDR